MSVDEQNADKTFLISPNPTSSFITIKNNKCVPFVLRIYNTTGQLLDSFYNNQTTFTTDLKRYNGTTFFIWVTGGTDVFTKVISVIR